MIGSDLENGFFEGMVRMEFPKMGKHLLWNCKGAEAADSAPWRTTLFCKAAFPVSSLPSPAWQVSCDHLGDGYKQHRLKSPAKERVPTSSLLLSRWEEMTFCCLITKPISSDLFSESKNTQKGTPSWLELKSPTVWHGLWTRTQWRRGGVIAYHSHPSHHCPHPRVLSYTWTKRKLY